MSVKDKFVDPDELWGDREPGDFWEGPNGYLKKLDDGTVVPVPQRECRCGKVGKATGTLPRYSCRDDDCQVVAFA